MNDTVAGKWLIGKMKQKFYYILFFVLFSIFFIFNLLSLPKEMGEQSVNDTAIRFIEYKNTNNLSLERALEVWDSIVDGDSRSAYVSKCIYGSPLFSFLRFYMLKLQLHPMMTFNIFNLITAILFFYSVYLLIKLLFENTIAIKSLSILLSFYGIYTVTRFSGRGYIVIGLAFILFGCYFIWKTILSGKQYYLIHAGIFMGLSWTTGNHMAWLTPGFLIITLMFYIVNYFKQNNYSLISLLKLFLGVFLFASSFAVVSIVIIKIISYELELDFMSLYKPFGKARVIYPGFNVAANEILRRLRLFIYFPKYSDVVLCFDEYIYRHALIPEFFIIFLFLSMFYLKSNFKAHSFKFVYLAIFALLLFIFIFTLPEWEIRYQLIFLPFLALFIVFGIEWYFNHLAFKIRNRNCRKVVSSVVISILSIIYLSKIYNVTFGDYAQSWNNSYNIAGHRAAADGLKMLYKRYGENIKSITLLQDFMSSDGMLAYLGFNPEHRYRMLGACGPDTEDSIPKLFEKYTKENGKVFIIVAEGWHYGRLVGWYPNIKLELIREIKLPKVRSFHGTGLKVYCVNGI